MRLEDLKVGNVIEVESGERFVVGFNSIAGMVLRKLVLTTYTFEHEISIDNFYDCFFRAKDGYFDKYSVFKIYENIGCLVDDSVQPIWERCPLYDLKFNELIWVRDKFDGEFGWRLSMFKGVSSDGKIIASWHKNIEAETLKATFSWDEWKPFSMDDLKEGN